MRLRLITSSCSPHPKRFLPKFCITVPGHHFRALESRVVHLKTIGEKGVLLRRGVLLRDVYLPAMIGAVLGRVADPKAEAPSFGERAEYIDATG